MCVERKERRGRLGNRRVGIIIIIIMITMVGCGSRPIPSLLDTVDNSPDAGAGMSRKEVCLLYHPVGRRRQRSVGSLDVCMCMFMRGVLSIFSNLHSGTRLGRSCYSYRDVPSACFTTDQICTPYHPIVLSYRPNMLYASYTIPYHVIPSYHAVACSGI